MKDRQADVVIVEFGSTLTESRFEYPKGYFKSHGIQVEVVKESKESSVRRLIEELVS